MRIHDETQNLRTRVGVIQVMTISIFVLLAGRTFMLQIVRGDYYSNIARSQRVRVLRIRAPRGAILNRHGKILVDSRPTYDIVVSADDLANIAVAHLIPSLSLGLEIDSDYLKTKFAAMHDQPAYESLTIKENVSRADLGWIDAHNVEYPWLQVEERPMRRYPANGFLAHVLGYVGEISPDELKLPRFRDAGYRSGDIIGKKGLEDVYDEYLRGRDGSRRVLVDALGHVRDTIDEVAPIPGQDLVTTIDSDLQAEAEQQLAQSPSQRGVIISINPNNGEILALASAPTFDPNLFTQRISTSEGRKEFNELLKDPDTPLYDRAIQGRYPPGSTWKVPMAIGALQEGVITLDDSALLCGGGIQIGNKFTRCMGHHGKPDLHTAIMKSCDGYFYRLGLKMGLAGIMAMVNEFQLNKKTGVDLPGELVSWTPSREFKARFNPRSPAWKDIDTVYASFGQVYEFVTPLALLHAYAGIATGELHTPHLMKEIKAVGEIDHPEYRPPVEYSDKFQKVLPIASEQREAVVAAMWSVVNDAGTAASIRKVGFDIAGKTGTAQVVGLGKDTGNKKDHSWFVSYAPAFKPQIAVLALIENSGFGSRYAAPAARAMYDLYFDRAPGAASQIAKRFESKTEIGWANKSARLAQ